MKRVNFRFSARITLTALILAAAMVRASVWQWDRHLEKQALIARLDETLLLEPIELRELLSTKPDWNALTFRRVKVSGSFDFQRELLLRNRNLEGRAGFHVITPLLIDGRSERILVDRGFIPLGREAPAQRAPFQKPARIEFVGLIKKSMTPELFAPNDPPAGEGLPWVDQWLRVNIPAIQKQLPYEVAPIYLEVMDDPDDPRLPSKIVKESAGGRSDVLVYTGQKQVENFGLDSPNVDYPIPTYDTTPPPDIHLGYVYEWAFMALLTLGIAVIMQFRRINSEVSR